MPEVPDWKSEFYDAYVSSGHALDTGEPAPSLFRQREYYLRNLIAKHIPADRDLKIIDLACGPGALLYFLELAGYRNIQGVDISDEQIAVARRVGVRSASCASLEECLDSQADSSVDVILAIDILEHFTPPQIMEILRSIRRVLKPGGRCVVHVPNGEAINGMNFFYGDLTHETALTKGSAKQLFRVAGFREVRCYEDRPIVHGAKSLVRRIIWDVGTLPNRLLRAAEEGCFGAILSQDLMIEAIL
jgi:2-polyprenyl-3-methyl-5-hydroxy-6-metoxy-1,4-benzoquinol methylase